MSTQADLVKFLNLFLNRGFARDRQILSPDTVREMTANQVDTIVSIPLEVKRNNPWGFGWQLKTPFRAMFGDLVSSGTFGHWGATGTLIWADPRSSLSCVVLTNQPFDGSGSILSRFSNAVAGSLTIRE